MLTSIYKRLCCCCCSKLCLTLCNPMNCSTPGFPAFTVSWSLFKLISIELVMSSNHLILCHPLLLLPSIFPSIRVFSNKLSLYIKWPKYWNYSFSIEAFELWWYGRLLDSEEIKPVHPKVDQSLVFTGTTDVKAETSVLWLPD